MGRAIIIAIGSNKRNRGGIFQIPMTKAEDEASIIIKRGRSSLDSGKLRKFMGS
jgi:hypothetical protein